MANEEHLDILAKGVDAWNEWRNENHAIRPHLSTANLNGANLSTANLNGADLSRANLNGAKLTGVDLSRANLSRANLRYANLSHAHLNTAVLTVADLTAADLTGANLSTANLNTANLNGADLSRANLSSADLSSANLSGANLSGAYLPFADLNSANLNSADLDGANLRSADLRYANLSHAHVNIAVLTAADLNGANLSSANLSSADLSGANLNGADLSGANLSGANLSGADLAGANLSGANLHSAGLAGANLNRAHLGGANLSGADLSGTKVNSARFGFTIFGDVDLTGVVDLADATHHGPSTIGIDTIYRNKGKIPEIFLRGAGVSENFITFMKSLTGAALDFYSVFISYSAKDQEFADCLHADLQSKGVRCWFAPHDIQGGRKIHEQIDEAIKVYDKLLLILSEASMGSNWVKTEIANARAKEEQQKRQVLFPLGVVPYDRIRSWKLPDGDTGIDSAREIREYFVPDFSNWRDHDSYSKAFDRLVRDLKAGSTVAG